MIRLSRDLAAGLFLIALAALATWQSSGLTLGTKARFGPGMLPLGLAALTALLGLGIVIAGIREKGPALDRWSWRSIFFLLGAAASFGLSVRPLGLLVAAPVVIIISSLASDETKPLEIVIFSIILTALCIGLFHYALRLPIPVAPWLIGY